MDVIISGINGRMGSYVYRILKNRTNYDVKYGLDQTKNYKNVLIYDDIKENADLLIDFSSRNYAMKVIKKALERKIKVLSGTTGLNKKDLFELSEISKVNKTSFIWCPNYALSQSVMYHTLEEIKDYFKSCDIIETHNINKKDKPSGTAIELANALDIDTNKIQSIRLNDVIASHTVYLNNPGERLTIKHEIITREAFLSGFINALDEISSLNYVLLVGLKDFFKYFK